MLNEIAYGVPFIGETEKEEWMKYAGGDEKAYAMKRMEEMEEQEMPSLQYQLEQAQAKSAGTKEKVPGYTSYHEKEILDDIKEKKQEYQGYLNIPEFYEGPAGAYVDVPTAGGAFTKKDEALAKVIADKKAKLEEYREKKYVAQEDWMENAGRRSDYAYASGGLTRTVAPESGPMDQGLPSLYNNVRKR